MMNQALPGRLSSTVSDTFPANGFRSITVSIVAVPFRLSA